MGKKLCELNAATALCALFAVSGCTTFRGPAGFRSEVGGFSSPLTNPSTAAAPGGQRSFDGAQERAPKAASRSNVSSDFQQGSSPNFDWPVDSARLSRGFKANRKAHWGLDLANRKGTRILAAEKGQVIYVGHEFHGYGNLIVIEHGDRWATLYAHLDKFYVKEGDAVSQGQTIAAMGRTGHATGPHLHFEIRQDRIPVDPMSLLPQGFDALPQGLRR